MAYGPETETPTRAAWSGTCETVGRFSEMHNCPRAGEWRACRSPLALVTKPHLRRLAGLAWQLRGRRAQAKVELRIAIAGQDVAVDFEPGHLQR